MVSSLVRSLDLRWDGSMRATRSAPSPRSAAEIVKARVYPWVAAAAARLRAGVVDNQVTGRRAGRDCAEDGDADRSADLLHGVDQRRCYAGVLSRDAGGGRVGGRGEDHAEAQAHGEQGGQYVPRVAGGHGELTQVGRSAAAQQQAGGDQHA